MFHSEMLIKLVGQMASFLEPVACIVHYSKYQTDDYMRGLQLFI